MDFIVVILIELFGFFNFDRFLVFIERFIIKLVFKVDMIMIFRCSCWCVFKIILKFVIFSGEEFFFFFFGHEESLRKFWIFHFKLALFLWGECRNVITQGKILNFFFLLLNNFFLFTDLLFDDFLWLLLLWH